MERITGNDAEFIHDVKMIKQDLRNGTLTLEQAQDALRTELGNYLINIK